MPYSLAPDMINLALVAQLRAERVHPAWYVWMKTNGDLVHQASAPIPFEPSVDRIIFADKVCRLANKHAWCDGGWVFGWSHWQMSSDDGPIIQLQPKTFWGFSKDLDGDGPCFWDDNRPWPQIAADGVDDAVDCCLYAVGKMNGVLKDAGVRDDQKVKLAQGQDAGGPGAPDFWPEFL